MTTKTDIESTFQSIASASISGLPNWGETPVKLIFDPAEASDIASDHEAPLENHHWPFATVGESDNVLIADLSTEACAVLYFDHEEALLHPVADSFDAFKTRIS